MCHRCPHRALYLIVPLLLAAFALQPALAQEKLVVLNRNELFRRYLAAGLFVKGGTLTPHWLADGNRFWYGSGTPDHPLVYLVDPQAKKKELMFDADRAREALTRRIGARAVFGFEQVAVEDDGRMVRFDSGSRTWHFDPKDGSVAEVTTEAVPDAAKPQLLKKSLMFGDKPVVEVPAPDKKRLAGEKDGNLYIRKVADGSVLPLTSDGVKEDAYSISDAQWSPDGALLAAMRVDARALPVFRVLSYLTPLPEMLAHNTTQPGGPKPRPHLFLFDTRGKKRTAVDVGPDAEQQLFLVRWLPNGSAYLFARASRNWKRFELLAADPASGKSRVLVSDTQPTFVETPMLSRLDVPVLGGGKQFLWLSERTGFNHIFLYDFSGKLLRQVTSGDWPVVRILDVDEPGGWIYFTAHGDRARPYDTHLYRVHLDGSGLTRLTEQPGEHDFSLYLGALEGAAAGVYLSPSKQFFIDEHSSTERPPAVDLRAADGTMVMSIERADVSRLKSLNWHPPEPFVVKAADGKTDLYGLIYKPIDFDPAKKYPVIDHIYNGPQTTWVPWTFNGAQGILPQALAQLGCIVFIVDGRGTPERGKAFQDVVYLNFGRNEVPDHVAALKQLAQQRPYIDLSRAGVFGGSFGGYMTVRAMLLAPEVYRVGVATSGINGMEDLPAAMEKYMGTPQQNPSGYEYASNYRLARRLKGKLLLIHGNLDVNAPFGSTIKLAEALIDANKVFDLQVLPDQTHSLVGRAQIYWRELIQHYFQGNLLNLPPGS